MSGYYSIYKGIKFCIHQYESRKPAPSNVEKAHPNGYYCAAIKLDDDYTSFTDCENYSDLEQDCFQDALNRTKRYIDKYGHKFNQQQGEII